MYYSAWDLQCNKYMYSGSNSSSIEELFEDLLDYASIDIDIEEDLDDWFKSWRNDMSGFFESWEFIIHEHDKKFNEEFTNDDEINIKEIIL